MATINDVLALFPKLRTYISDKIHEAEELQDRTIAYVSRGEAKETNARGAREVVDVRYNPNYGSIGENGIFRPGAGHQSVELLIGYTKYHISGYITGDQIRNAKKNAIGGKMADLIRKDYMVLRKQRNIDFCHGDGLFSRGLIAGTPTVAAGISTVTFNSAEGSRLLDPGGVYVVHNATTGAVIGAAAGFPLIDKPTKLTARFTGDLNALGDLTGRIMVPIGSADNESTFLRAILGLDKFSGAAGDYFGVNRDSIDEMRGIQVDGAGENVDPALLEQGMTLFMYRWNLQESDVSHIDSIPPAQWAAYKKNAYPLLRLEGQGYKNFDGAVLKISDGERMVLVDAHLPPNKWHRWNPEGAARYVLEEMGIWNLDGLEARPPHVSGSIRDAVQWHIQCADQCAHVNPAKNIVYTNLGTAGVKTGTN